MRRDYGPLVEGVKEDGGRYCEYPREGDGVLFQLTNEAIECKLGREVRKWSGLVLVSR